MSPLPDGHEDGRWRGRMEEKVDTLTATSAEDRRASSSHRADIRNRLGQQDGILSRLQRDVEQLTVEFVPIVKSLRDDKIRAGGMVVVLAIAGSAAAAILVPLVGVVFKALTGLG